MRLAGPQPDVRRGSGGRQPDTDVHRAVGVALKPTPKVDVAFDVQQVRYSEIKSILAPGVIEQHATFGLSKDLAAGKTLNVAVTRAFSHSVTGQNPLEIPGRQQITLTMSQWDLEFGYSIKF